MYVLKDKFLQTENILIECNLIREVCILNIYSCYNLADNGNNTEVFCDVTQLCFICSPRWLFLDSLILQIRAERSFTTLVTIYQSKRRNILEYLDFFYNTVLGTSNHEIEFYFYTQVYTHFPINYSKGSFPSTEVARAWSWPITFFQFQG